jgi:hypothetical protein
VYETAAFVSVCSAGRQKSIKQVMTLESIGSRFAQLPASTGNGRKTAEIVSRPTISAEAGTETNWSGWPGGNVSSSIRRSFESGPKVTVRRLEQNLKEPAERTSTDDGIQIDSNESQNAKTQEPIDRRDESVSNSTVLSLVFPRQQ